MLNSNFFERYRETFEIVCRVLGNGWRINTVDTCEYRLKLTSPLFKKYSLYIRMEKGRLVIIGSVDSRNWRSPYHTCTVSAQRNPVAIAADIYNKILINALHDIEISKEYDNKLQKEQEKNQILKGMLSQLVMLEHWHGTLTGFKAVNGLSGHVTERGDGYEVLIRGLDLDQLVKLSGLIKHL